MTWQDVAIFAIFGAVAAFGLWLSFKSGGGPTQHRTSWADVATDALLVVLLIVALLVGK